MVKASVYKLVWCECFDLLTDVRHFQFFFHAWQAFESRLLLLGCSFLRIPKGRDDAGWE